MPLPISLPNIEILSYLLYIAAFLLALTSLGALIKIWSWKVPRTLIIAFGGVIIMFIAISWIFGSLSG